MVAPCVSPRAESFSEHGAVTAISEDTTAMDLENCLNRDAIQAFMAKTIFLP